MKRYLKNIILFAYVKFWAPVRNFIRKIQGRCHVTILVYHRVNDGYHDSVTVGIEQFQQQIRLAKKRYEILKMNDFLDSRKISRSRPGILFTFDDGYEDNFMASKMLYQEGISAVFFLSTRIVGTDKAFPHDIRRLGERIPSLAWDQVRQMAQWGHQFGSHTADHPNLSELDQKIALEQIRTGQRDLSEKLGDYAMVDWFAYPHGRPEDLPKKLRIALPKLGIRFCFSAYGGVNLPNFDPYDIKRQGIDHGFSDLAFLAALEGWRVRLPTR